MKIKVKQPKIINLYSFISHLSQWNELVCIPQRKKEWLKKTGKLTNAEKQALSEFSEIFQKAQSNLEPIFLFNDEQEIWPNLIKKVGNQKTLRTQAIFKILEKKFGLIWQTENKKLKVIRESFESNEAKVKSNLLVIEKLCGLAKNQLPSQIELKLLLSSNQKEECQGWSFKEVVVLECSGWPITKINYLISNIFLHECFHIFLQKNQKLLSEIRSVVKDNQQLINKVKLKNWPAEVVFKEALISSFLPEGYLAEKFLKINPIKIAQDKLASKKLDNFSRLRFFCALNLYPLAKEYCEQNKQIDKHYLEKAISCLKKFA